MPKLTQKFFRQSAAVVAEQLIGAVMVRPMADRTLRARLVETEAYMGPEDLASHASKGLTRRTQVMFGPAGRAYVYLIYGMYEMLNVVTGKTGGAHAVLLRAAEPLDGWDVDLSGPGKLARAFGITRSMNHLNLTGNELYFEKSRGERPSICRTPRIGIDYAEHWKHELLRFTDACSRAVSRSKAVSGRKAGGSRPRRRMAKS